MSVHSMYVCVCARNKCVGARTALFVSAKSSTHTETHTYKLVVTCQDN